MTCRGVVKGNTILLDDQAHLPDGAAVEVRVLAPYEEAVEQHNGAGTSAIESASGSSEDPFKALLARRAANAGLRVHMDEIIEEEKQDREERFDHISSTPPGLSSSMPLRSPTSTINGSTIASMSPWPSERR